MVDNRSTDASAHVYARCCALVAEQLQKAEEARRDLLVQYDGKRLHAWRVNLRRATVTVPLIAACFPDHPAGGLRDELKRWRDVTGANRDLDILADETLPNFASDHPDVLASAAWLSTLQQQRDEARARSLAALDSGSLASLTAQFHALAMRRPPPDDARMQQIADEALDAAWRKLVHRAERLDGSRKRLHRLRAATKTMRYTIGLFQLLYAPKAATSWLEALAALQTDLGRAHDRMMARKIARHLRGDPHRDTFAKPFDRWARHRAHRAAAHAENTCKHLLKSTPFWRH